jgi:hypothetical protein
MATPFVQGRLRKEYVSIEVETKCKHCDQALHLTIDSDMRISVRETDAKPLAFLPDIDWSNFTERTIIDSY